MDERANMIHKALIELHLVEDGRAILVRMEKIAFMEDQADGVLLYIDGMMEHPRHVHGSVRWMMKTIENIYRDVYGPGDVVAKSVEVE